MLAEAQGAQNFSFRYDSTRSNAGRQDIRSRKQSCNHKGHPQNDSKAYSKPKTITGKSFEFLNGCIDILRAKYPNTFSNIKYSPLASENPKLH